MLLYALLAGVYILSKSQPTREEGNKICAAPGFAVQQSWDPRFAQYNPRMVQMYVLYQCPEDTEDNEES